MPTPSWTGGGHGVHAHGGAHIVTQDDLQLASPDRLVDDEGRQYDDPQACNARFTNRITISQVELGLHGGGASSRKAPLAAFFHIAVADTWQRRQIFRRMGASVAIEE